MKTEIQKVQLEELTLEESTGLFGGGQSAELAYNLVYFGLRTSPIFWLAKFDAAVINAVS